MRQTAPTMEQTMRRPHVIARFEIACIRLYQRTLSPLIGTQCRFHPTCSAYAITCIERHGVLRGTRLAAVRLASCHPWGRAGIDEPPGVPTNDD